ncbi:MAG: flavodoxin domain-containing protein [Oscillospiraceae bacterium]
MSRGIILYQSKYGATKKYADWLVEELGFVCMETKKATLEQVKKFDIIVLCGGIYASGIAGLKFLKNNYNEIKNKKTVVFCVGASPYDEKALEDIKAFNLKGDLGNIPLFYGRGAWDESIMSFKDRTLCKMLQKAVAKKDPSDYEPWMKALMCAVGQKCDWTDKEYLRPLIQYVLQ